MTNYRRTIRFFVLLIAIEAILIFGAIVAFDLVDDADAHTARPVACQSYWQAAPVGQKYQAKQRCLAAQRRHNCITHQRPVPGYVRVKGQRLERGGSEHWRNQREVVGWIVNEGLRRDLSPTFVLAALVATTQESSARELTYGHGTSLGPFQLIDSHGDAWQRITIEFSGNWFYNGATKDWRAHGPMSAPALAQDVEASGNPYAYGQWLSESRRTLEAVLGPCRLR